MGKTIIITDSGCDIPEHMISIFSDNIKVIPYTVHFTKDEYLKDNRINKRSFSQSMNLGMRPVCIKLDKNDVLKVLNELDEKYDEIIFITSSGMLYPESEIAIKSAVLKYFSDHIKARVAIIDSNTTSMALGFLVLDAAKMIDMQYDFDEIVRYVKTNKSRYRMDVIANDPTIPKDHRIINSRQAKLTTSHKKYYLLSMTRFGLLRPIMAKSDERLIKDVMMERLFDDYTDKYAIVSTLLNDEELYFSENITKVMELDPVKSKFGCSNTSFVGTDSISLCYKKKQ